MYQLVASPPPSGTASPPGCSGVVLGPVVREVSPLHHLQHKRLPIRGKPQVIDARGKRGEVDAAIGCTGGEEGGQWAAGEVEEGAGIGLAGGQVAVLEYRSGEGIGENADRLELSRFAGGIDHAVFSRVIAAGGDDGRKEVAQVLAPEWDVGDGMPGRIIEAIP